MSRSCGANGTSFSSRSSSDAEVVAFVSSFESIQLAVSLDVELVKRSETESSVESDHRATVGRTESEVLGRKDMLAGFGNRGVEEYVRWAKG